MNITVLGGGAWGTAIAQLLAGKHSETIKLWCYESEVAQEIQAKRCNERYLPKISLEKNIEATSDLEYALKDAHCVFEAVPVKFLRSVLQECKPFFSDKQIWVVLSKGIESETLLLPSQIVDDVFGTTVKKAVLSGPSFAKDLAKKQITAVTVASEDKKLAQDLHHLISSKKYFKTYVSQDLLGVQLGGALKNVFALGVGMLDGAGFGDNTKAFFLTTGLKEMSACAFALGADEKTMYGLSGVGDLVLTCMGGQSRNLAVGKRLGAGESLSKILDETGFVPEGINTVRSVGQLITKHNLHLPILSGMYGVIFEKKKIGQLLSDLIELD